MSNQQNDDFHEAMKKANEAAKNALENIKATQKLNQEIVEILQEWKKNST